MLCFFFRNSMVYYGHNVESLGGIVDLLLIYQDPDLIKCS